MENKALDLIGTRTVIAWLRSKGYEVIKTDARPSTRIDYAALMNTYNTTFSGRLPAITSMTESRKRAVRARVVEHGKESIMKVFRNVLASSFLLGENEHNWKCNFDWIFKPNNFIKILEGNYNGQRTDTNKSRKESVNRLKDLAEAILLGTEPGNGQ